MKKGDTVKVIEIHTDDNYNIIHSKNKKEKDLSNNILKAEFIIDKIFDFTYTAKDTTGCFLKPTNEYSKLFGADIICFLAVKLKIINKT